MALAFPSGMSWMGFGPSMKPVNTMGLPNRKLLCMTRTSPSITPSIVASPPRQSGLKRSVWEFVGSLFRFPLAVKIPRPKSWNAIILSRVSSSRNFVSLVGTSSRFKVMAQVIVLANRTRPLDIG